MVSFHVLYVFLCVYLKKNLMHKLCYWVSCVVLLCGFLCGLATYSFILFLMWFCFFCFFMWFYDLFIVFNHLLSNFQTKSMSNKEFIE